MNADACLNQAKAHPRWFKCPDCDAAIGEWCLGKGESGEEPGLHSRRIAVALNSPINRQISEPLETKHEKI